MLKSKKTAKSSKNSGASGFFSNTAQNKTADLSYDNFIQTGTAKLAPSRLSRQQGRQTLSLAPCIEYKTASSQSAMAEDSYHRFLQTRTATLATASLKLSVPANVNDSVYVKKDLQLPHTTAPSLQTENKMTEMKQALASSPSLKSLETTAVKLGVSTLCAEVEGLAIYLKPKITAVKLVVNSYGRIEESLQQQVKPLEGITCGALGASAEVLTSMGGNAVVLSAATTTVVGFSAAGPLGTGVGLVGASIIADTGLNAVAQASSLVGNVTQSACHAAFDWGRSLSNSEQPATSMRNAPNLPTLRKF